MQVILGIFTQTVTTLSLAILIWTKSFKSSQRKTARIKTGCSSLVQVLRRCKIKLECHCKVLKRFFISKANLWSAKLTVAANSQSRFWKLTWKNQNKVTLRKSNKTIFARYHQKKQFSLRKTTIHQSRYYSIIPN